MKTWILLLCIAFLFPWQKARGQETRKMVFALGAASNELLIEVEYHDPGELHDRLRGSRLLPVKLSISNVAGRPISLNYSDIRLNVNGSQALTPVEPAAVADEIRRLGGRLPRLMSFLATQATTFHRTELDRRRLRDGAVEPGGNKEGFVFFMRPNDAQAELFNGVMWLETAGYPPQALETKDISVQTAPKPTALERIRQMWETIVSGEFPYKRSYAFLVGIGNYKYLNPLSSPALDVKKMKKFLESQGFDEVIAIQNESVTPETFKQPQKYFSTKIQPGDRFLFYYSGHGVSAEENGKPRGYIPLWNAPKEGTANSVPMDSLVRWMKSLNTKHLLVIMDSCFSGLAIDGIETRGPDRVLLNMLGAGPARFLMMAGTDQQESIADKKWNGSLFTEMLIRGVQSAKFEDRTHDKIVATHALYGWLRPMVSTEALKVNRQLTPLLKDLEDVSKGEFLFFRQ